MTGLGVAPDLDQIGPVIDAVSAVTYGLPTDAFPVAQEPQGMQCLSVANALTGSQDPSEPFYSPSTAQYYCGPVQYVGTGSTPSNTPYLIAALIAAGALWWYWRNA